MNKSLYEIDSEFAAILARLDELEEGELPDDILSDIDALDMDWRTKLENYGKYIKACEEEAAGVKGRIDYVQSEATRLYETQLRPLENKIARMKQAIQHSLAIRNEKKCKTDLFSFSICNNSRPTIDVDNPDFLPDEYKKVKTLVMADTEKLLADWKQGIEPPQGVEIKLGNHLRIR